ncbi:alkaline phosphatase, tissue-nonspecific isozyme-like [Mercenaria mercenaria]|uniref:alkaline phosphatase, tissue-nonspecific isozyme-like n=1 Tax=Mercenaria mercenaria TaxID=6596 RepID=UPI00234F4B47|nr:alkaline phosphatase, tissue-nonspecific isozyme-like [Mercenaria mercenaria]
MDALRMTNKEETLVIVTADHSHVFDIAGYAYRGTDIFGLVEPVDPTEETLDDKPYSVLFYGNGPAYSEPRENLTGVDMHDKDFAFPSGVPAPWETHGGEDVAIYAQGPMAHLIHGVQEQNYIAHVMAYSACIGPYQGDNCDMETRNAETSSANRLVNSCVAILLLTIFIRAGIL